MGASAVTRHRAPDIADKLIVFFARELCRGGSERPVGIDLLYRHGDGHYDEPLITWGNDASVVVADFDPSDVTSRILRRAIAFAEQSRSTSARFAVRVRQYMAGRTIYFFTIEGDADE